MRAPADEIEASGFAALGLYDADAPNAGERLELLHYLVGLGATTEDLLAYQNELPGVASVVVLRSGSPLTIAEVAERSGVPVPKVRAFNRAAGFPEPGPDDRVLSEEFVANAAGWAAAEALFGEEAILQLVRVMGSAMARVADALVSAFLVNVEPAARTEDAVELAVARANAEAAGLLTTVSPVLDMLLRQHLIAARRSLDYSPDSGFETQRLCVGFVDLVGSTALAARLSTRDFGRLLTDFENLASDTVTASGGHVIKLIGDGILYTATSERTACKIALELAAKFTDHPTVPPVRAAVAAGEVMLRGGDVFGPVVNLAAHTVKVAEPGRVVTPLEVAAAAGLPAQPLGHPDLKGFDSTLQLCLLQPLSA